MEVIYSVMIEGLTVSMARVTSESPLAMPGVNACDMMRLASSEGPNVGALSDTAQTSRAGKFA